MKFPAAYISQFKLLLVVHSLDFCDSLADPEVILWVGGQLQVLEHIGSTAAHQLLANKQKNVLVITSIEPHM